MTPQDYYTDEESPYYQDIRDQVEEIPLECPQCGEIHSNTLLEQTGDKCPKEN